MRLKTFLEKQLFLYSREFILHIYMCMLRHFSHVQLFATLWTVAKQALLSVGFSRRGYWSGLPCLIQGDLPHPGIKSASPPALHMDSLLLSHWGPTSHTHTHKLLIKEKTKKNLLNRA